MAWTAPVTWVDGAIINASGSGSLNEQIRDNMLALSTHAHSGGAGDGSSTLTGVSFSSITSMGFADQSANPSSTGVMQRNGTAVLYYNGSSAIDLTTADASAGTASLRTLGSGATTASAGNHSHTLTVSGGSGTNTIQSSSLLTCIGSPPSDAGMAKSEVDLYNATYTASSNVSAVGIVAGAFVADNTYSGTGAPATGITANNVTLTVKLYYGGALKQTITGLTTNLGSYGYGVSNTLRYVGEGSTSGKNVRLTAQITSANITYADTTDYGNSSGGSANVGWLTPTGYLRSANFSIYESQFSLGVA